MDFSRLSVLNSCDEAVNIKILDTTDLVLHEVAAQLADWMNHTKNTEHSQPIPDAAYILVFNISNAYNTINQKLFKFNK